MERGFDFPGEPYSVQVDFMSNLYNCLTNCKVGIFESPTGTGKSLSLICSSFKWLASQTNDPNFSGSQSWVNEIQAPALTEITNKQDSKIPELYSEKEETPLKIVYISRTHSQLDQFMNEIKKTVWRDKMKVIRLGSRSQLCVNPEMAGYKGRGVIDFKCKELTNIESEASCRYFKSSTALKNHCLEKICDIEDLIVYAKRHMACPYYATRSAIPAAQVILAPYSSVLSKRNRESIGLNLDNSILIIDEAHNITEAMVDCYSSNLSKSHAESAYSAIKEYHGRFGNKIGARSLMFFDQILDFLGSIIKFMCVHCANPKKSGSMSVGEFLIETNLERFDFFKILAFIEEIDFSTKVVKLSEKAGNRNSISSIPIFIEFLRALCDDVSAGKILLNVNEEQMIRYLLLNPSKKFMEIAESTRCLILAGGTMEPKEEYIDLFSTLPRSQIMLFSCDHVISPQNLLMGVVSKGASGSDFRFTFDNRDNTKLLSDLCTLTLDLCACVPNGIIVFLPSYFFLTKLKSYIERSGFLERFKRLKSVFFDNKDENILEAYSKSALQPGAILYAVVRGKLSEGINFSDYLGRCVLMVGMPYLNISDAEIKEKMEFLDRSGKGYSGRVFYENACHKAINQSIGRAIRHKNDYAVILLVDERHNRTIQRRPEWMRKNLLLRDDVLSKRIQEFFRALAK